MTRAKGMDWVYCRIESVAQVKRELLVLFAKHYIITVMICIQSLIKDCHDSFLYYFLFKICEPSCSDIPFTVVFNPVNNNTTGIFSKKINPIDSYSSVRDVLVHFLNKLQEANDFFEQHFSVSHAFDELPYVQLFFETSELDKVKRLVIQHHWFLRNLAQINALQCTFFSPKTVFDTLTIAQCEFYFLFQRNF